MFALLALAAELVAAPASRSGNGPDPIAITHITVIDVVPCAANYG